MSSTEEKSARVASPARTPILAFVIGALVAACGGGLLIAILLSDTLITARAREALVERGVVCDERFAVDVDWSFSEATLAPTRCSLVRVTFADAVELPEGASATLAGFAPTELRIPTARILLVDAPPPTADLGPMGVLGQLTGVGPRVSATGRATSEIAAHQPVPTTITRLELVRDGEVEVAVSDLAIGGDEPTTFHASRAELSAIEGPLGLSVNAAITELEGTATASTCHIEGDLAVGARVPILGALSHGAHVVLEGTGLDGPSPRYSVSTP